ncbi:MAG: DoxX-like family protein [Bacteroidota bacterium]
MGAEGSWNWRKKGVNFAIGGVWLVNGLYCKLLNFVPRHQEIVGRILGEEWAFLATKAIGVSELLMVLWVWSGIQSRYAALFQIFIVMTMNVIEFTLVPDLLLHGRLNIVFALLFCLVVYWNEFKNR